MTTVIFLFAIIGTALACFRQPPLSNPLPGFGPPSLSPPPQTRKPPPATPSTTTASTVLGVVIFVLKRPWPSDQSEVTKYVSDFDNELRLHAKKQGILFERFGQPVTTKKSGKITVDYYLQGTDIVCEEVENFVEDVKKKFRKFIRKGLASC